MPILALATIASALPTSAGASGSSTTSATPPPQIYHIITRPLCSELHKHIAPAIGMMLQNDQNIKKGPELFSRYNRDALNGANNAASNSAGPNGGVVMSGDSSNGTMTASQNMALLGMENLVSPIANNIIATQKMLDSPALTQGTGNPQDDKQLQDIRAKLLKALATQNAALDIINGFVATQQMGDLQHAGQEYISAMNQSDQTGRSSGATPTPNPLLADPNQAGLPPNPYDINLAAIPGLTLGYNPVTRLLEALHWTIQETSARENEAARSVMNGAAECAASAPKPVSTSKP
ncbi:MAG: hypothetical protein JOZ01_07365 [Candidatus Eremiobacteraeota bacterium]|nr:hypothetical protein [Candidatus Eremiobacteraeota bacterium]